MIKTRFMVFKMSQIIRMGIFALIGIILLIALILFMKPKKHNAGMALYNPGTYSAQIILQNKPVLVEVTVTDNEITTVELKNMKESQEVFYPLFKPTMDELARDIVRYQSTNIDTGEDAVVTGRILLDAVNAALAKAVI